MPVRVLLIEENDSDASLVLATLAAAGYHVESRQVSDAELLRAVLEQQTWDVVIADYSASALGGSASLALVREHDAHVPFIFVSSTSGEEIAVAAMRTGAHDYIGKGNLTRLASAVEREMREAEARRARTRAEQRLAYLAYHDPLTDLPNRTLLQDRLQQAIARAQRDSSSVALLVMDLDGFKAINDALGHHVGDRVLQQIASRLRTFLREVDTVARMGGDEFAIVLPSTDEYGAELAARKILTEIARPLMLDGQPFVMQASIGIAVCPRHGTSVDPLLRKADASMYVAKQDRAGYSLYSPDRDQQTNNRLSLVAEFRRGLAEGQFVLEYQPIVDLRTGDLVATEALVRWNHPERGRLLPAEFVSLAEQTGLADGLTMFVLDRALADRPQTSRRPSASMTVNLSPVNLHDRHFPEHVGDLLRKHGLPPASLVLEITEDLILSDPARSTVCLTRLHHMGVRLSVDDFGTGYSSLTYLRRLPIDTLKIDRSFVIGMDRGEDDVIVRSTIDLAHNLGLSVVAEGVESQAMWNRLSALRCDAAQGTFIGQPQSAPDFRLWLAHRDAVSGPRI